MPYLDPKARKRQQRRYYRQHRAEIITRARQWDVDHPKRADQRKKEWHGLHHGLHLCRCRRNYKLNRPERLWKCLEWQMRNTTLVRHYKRKTDQRYRQDLNPIYIRRLLTQAGLTATRKNVNQLKEKIRLWRTQQQFRLMAAAGQLLKST